LATNDVADEAPPMPIEEAIRILMRVLQADIERGIPARVRATLPEGGGQKATAQEIATDPRYRNTRVLLAGWFGVDFPEDDLEGTFMPLGKMDSEGRGWARALGEGFFRQEEGRRGATELPTLGGPRGPGPISPTGVPPSRGRHIPPLIGEKGGYLGLAAVDAAKYVQRFVDNLPEEEKLPTGTVEEQLIGLSGAAGGIDPDSLVDVVDRGYVPPGGEPAVEEVPTTTPSAPPAGPFRTIAPGEALTGSVGRIRTRLQGAREAVRDFMPGGARYGPARGEEVLEPGEVAAVDLQAEQDLGLVAMDITGPDIAVREAAEAGTDKQALNIFDKIDRHEEAGDLSAEVADMYRAELAPLLGWADVGRRNPWYLTEAEADGLNPSQRASLIAAKVESEHAVAGEGGAISELVRSFAESGAEVAGSDQPEWLGPESPILKSMLFSALSDMGVRIAVSVAGTEATKEDAKVRALELDKLTAQTLTAQIEAKNQEALSNYNLLFAARSAAKEKILLQEAELEASLSAGPRHYKAVASRSQDLVGKTYGAGVGGFAELKHDFDYWLQMHMKVAELSKVQLDPREATSSFMAMVDVDVKPHIRAGLERRASEVFGRGTQRRAAQTFRPQLVGGQPGAYAPSSPAAAPAPTFRPQLVGGQPGAYASSSPGVSPAQVSSALDRVAVGGQY
jgi:hypothetical protein